MVDYDARSALLVVDVQNDFADRQGSLYVKGGEAVVRFANAEAKRARAGGASVVYSQDWHPPSTPHFQTEGGIWPVHCVRDSWGAAFPSNLVVGDAPVIRKGSGGEDGYSAFSARDPRSGAESATPLAALLRDRGVERIVVIGLATDYCVKETALDGCRLGFQVTVLKDGVRAVDLQPGDGERALQAIEEAGGRVE